MASEMGWEEELTDDLACRDLRQRCSRIQKHATLQDYVSLCNWIRAEAKGQELKVHVTAPQDATIDRLQELRRLGVRVTVERLDHATMTPALVPPRE